MCKECLHSVARQWSLNAGAATELCPELTSASSDADRASLSRKWTIPVT
jgi:hypothetical protein